MVLKGHCACHKRFTFQIQKIFLTPIKSHNTQHRFQRNVVFCKSVLKRNLRRKTITGVRSWAISHFMQAINLLQGLTLPKNCPEQQWQRTWHQCKPGLLTLSFPSVLRWSLQPFLAEWFYHHHWQCSSSLLHHCSWRLLQGAVWCWMLADPPDPAGYVHRSNRRHKDAHWNKENEW